LHMKALPLPVDVRPPQATDLTAAETCARHQTEPNLDA
jgi:hypothetical protein